MCAGVGGAPPDRAQSSSSPSSILTAPPLVSVCITPDELMAVYHRQYVSFPGPSGAPETGDSEDVVSFGSILEHSICRQQRLHGWCEQCSKYKSTVGGWSLLTLQY